MRCSTTLMLLCGFLIAAPGPTDVALGQNGQPSSAPPTPADNGSDADASEAWSENEPQQTDGQQPHTADHELAANAEDAEFLATNRSGPADRLAQSDPAFDRFVDFGRLHAAFHQQDVEPLVDVLLSLAEAERTLQRYHQSGVTSDAFIQRIASYVAKYGDDKQLERIRVAADQLKKKAWIEAIDAAKEFAAKPRAPAPEIPIDELTHRKVTALSEISEAIRIAELTGDATELASICEQIEEREGLSDAEKTHLAHAAEAASQSIGDVKDDPTAELLKEFSAESRCTELLDDWLPHGGPFGFSIRGMRYVAHYHVRICRHRIKINGWWYTRVAGHKTNEDTDHQLLSIRLNNGQLNHVTEWYVHQSLPFKYRTEILVNCHSRFARVTIKLVSGSRTLATVFSASGNW